MNLETATKEIHLLAYDATLDNGLKARVVDFQPLLEILSKVSEPQQKTPQEYLKMYSEDEMRPIDLIKLIIDDCKK